MSLKIFSNVFAVVQDPAFYFNFNEVPENTFRIRIENIAFRFFPNCRVEVGTEGKCSALQQVKYTRFNCRKRIRNKSYSGQENLICLAIANLNIDYNYYMGEASIYIILKIIK